LARSSTEIVVEQARGARPSAATTWVALATLYVVWGSTYLAIRVIVERVPPLAAAGVRFLAAGVLLGVVLSVRGGRSRWRIPRRQLAGAVGVSFFTLFAAFSLLFLGETHVPSALAALLIASIPLWVVVLRLLAREPVSRATVASVALGFAGVAVLVLPSGGASGVGTLWLLVVVGAAVTEAVGSFGSQRVRLPTDPFVTATLQMLAAGVLTLVVALSIGEASDFRLSDVSWKVGLAFAYLVVPGSILAYSAFIWLLQTGSVSTATTYAYVNPVVAIVLGWALLSEDVATTMIVGAVAIVASVAVVVRHESARGVSESGERA
jgi:drug/metabolite transporter (DMT)-like permease